MLCFNTYKNISKSMIDTNCSQETYKQLTAMLKNSFVPMENDFNFFPIELFNYCFDTIMKPDNLKTLYYNEPVIINLVRFDLKYEYAYLNGIILNEDTSLIDWKNNKKHLIYIGDQVVGIIIRNLDEAYHFLLAICFEESIKEQIMIQNSLFAHESLRDDLIHLQDTYCDEYSPLPYYSKWVEILVEIFYPYDENEENRKKIEKYFAQYLQFDYLDIYYSGESLFIRNMGKNSYNAEDFIDDICILEEQMQKELIKYLDKEEFLDSDEYEIILNKRTKLLVSFLEKHNIHADSQIVIYE